MLGIADNPVNYFDPDGKFIWGVIGLAGFLIGTVLSKYLESVDAESKWVVAAIIAGGILRWGGVILLIYQIGSIIAQIAENYVSRIVTEMKTTAGPGAFERKLIAYTIETTYWAFTEM